MSEFVYTKSITTDFGGNFNSTNLKNDIVSQGLTPNLLRIDRLGDSIDIVFDGALSAGEVTLLGSNIIANHSSVAIQKYTAVINNIPKIVQSKNSNYTRICTFRYEGSNYIDDIKKIVAISYMDDDATDYSILIEDKTNDLIIAETTFTNTSEESVVLTPINNVPTSTAKIEVYIKINGDKKHYVYVESVIFYLG